MFLALLLAACNRDHAPPSGTTPVAPGDEPGVAPLVKLSTVQYRNTVTDLLLGSGLGAVLPDVQPLLDAVPADSTDTFRDLDPRVSTEHVTAFFNVARTVGDAVEADAGLRSALAGPCAAEAELTAACTDAFLRDFGRRVLRRPLTDEELARYAALDDGTRGTAEAVRAMVVSLLLAPQFLNHVEVDGEAVDGRDDLWRLDPYALASRLSYTFWQTMPDDALLDAAADGSLATEPGWAAAVDRVFDDPRTEQTLWQFWLEWLRLERFTGFSATRPAFQTLAAGEHLGEPGHDHWSDMVEEVALLTSLVVWDQGGTLTDLLTTQVSVTPSADLAHLYGVAPYTGGSWPTLPASERTGLLQRGALLASSLEQTNPFHRGAFVRRYLLCDPLPTPDPATLPRIARRAARRRRVHHPRALRGQGRRQPHLRGLPRRVQRHRLRDGGVRRPRAVPDHRARAGRDQRRRAQRAAHRHGRRAPGDLRRRPARLRPGRAQRAHPGERQDGELPGGAVLLLRAAAAPVRRRRRRGPRGGPGGRRAARRAVPRGGAAPELPAEARWRVKPAISRRHLLRGAGGALLAVPLLESMASRAALAQPPPKRLIVMKSFSTQLIREWYPTLRGNGYQLHDEVYSDWKADGTTLLHEPLAGGPYTQAPLVDFTKGDGAGGVSGILGPRLDPFLSKLLLIRGLDFLPSVNHNYGGILGNYSSCTAATPCDADTLADIPTIDQVLAYAEKFYPTQPWARHLHVSQGVEDTMSYTDFGVYGGPVQQLKARTNPLDAWNDLFGGFDPNAGAQPDGSRDKLLIDGVLEDYQRLRDHRRLSAADRQALDQYVTLVTELQAKLATTQVLSCTVPEAPEALANNSGTDPADIERKWSLFLDVVVAGLMCDQTRIVTMGLHKALGPGPDPDDPVLVGHYHSEDASGGTWHGLAHDWGNENSRRMLAGINAWLAEFVFAELLERLDVDEGGGSTFLDNSLVYWGNELGFNHIAYSVPCILAGSAGGFLQTGRYLDYVDWNGRAYFGQEDGTVIKGIPHNRLLVTILQAMGLEPADYERDGAPGYGSSSTSGRDGSLWPVDYDFDAVGEILPGIRG
ncbi:MAG: DUF1552 domain-containing protein [Myxococcota bacterium]